MPSISMFFGIIIYMYYYDNGKHHTPHIHAKYQEFEAVISIVDGNVIEGDIPNNKLKLIKAWVEIHTEELLADWQLAVNGEKLYEIQPLR